MFMKNTGVGLIAKERERQILLEGYHLEQDLKYKNGELANAGAYYALTDELLEFIDNSWGNDMHLHIWPFSLEFLKRTPEDRIKQLSKSGALIAAEIDRLIENKDDVSTLIMYNDCLTEMQYAIVKGDYSQFNNVYINSGKKEKLEYEAGDFLFNENGEFRFKLVNDISLVENKEWDKIALITFLP